ncbi:hypothetical protein EIN_058790 [Entamoeba invadens IP1]|uniref:hypothetical protein n=1 Tax=Entamoeba invadens IP1 TaxID=370355 RepID=UPI0002C3F794|nr:hypothetical protein EIN_058790 [Entamoeba invadens IP1]ELP93424.1 hypothetical protein EIN_058790 [Entamoeba invadens IP1]|eukprot:XP_004260195.1 hypothetical protein EIN_058790 [Entamoeba invadens IP1]
MLSPLHPAQQKKRTRSLNYEHSSPLFTKNENKIASKPTIYAYSYDNKYSQEEFLASLFFETNSELLKAYYWTLGNNTHFEQFTLLNYFSTRGKLCLLFENVVDFEFENPPENILTFLTHSHFVQMYNIYLQHYCAKSIYDITQKVVKRIEELNEETQTLSFQEIIHSLCNVLYTTVFQIPEHLAILLKIVFLKVQESYGNNLAVHFFVVLFFKHYVAIPFIKFAPFKTALIKLATSSMNNKTERSARSLLNVSYFLLSTFVHSPVITSTKISPPCQITKTRENMVKVIKQNFKELVKANVSVIALDTITSKIGDSGNHLDYQKTSEKCGEVSEFFTERMDIAVQYNESLKTEVQRMEKINKRLREKIKEAQYNEYNVL